jgi:phosphate transport system protein
MVLQARDGMSERTNDEPYQAELVSFGRRITSMGLRVEMMASNALRALRDHDAEVARTTIEAAMKVDDLELEIDRTSLDLFRRYKPARGELRFVANALEVVRHFKRIAEHSLIVCERTLEIVTAQAIEKKSSAVGAANSFEPSLSEDETIQWLGRTALDMLHDARDAFAHADAPKAEQVLTRHGAVRVRCEALQPDLMALMKANPRRISQAARLQSISKQLELIADDAADIAETAVMMATTADTSSVEQRCEPQRHSSAV